MNDIRFSLLAGWLCVLLMAGGCKSADDSKAPVSLTWEMGNYDENGKYYENSFVLKNISDAPLGKDWEIFYSQFPRKILPNASSPVKVEQVNATYFKMYPGEGFASLAPGDSLKVIFKCDGEVPKNSHAPEGAYWVSRSGAIPKENRFLWCWMPFHYPLQNGKSLPRKKLTTPIFVWQTRILQNPVRQISYLP